MSENSSEDQQSNVRDREILQVFEKAEEPILSTKEVAEELRIGDRATRNRLSNLAQEGRLGVKEIAGSKAWWDVNIEAAQAWSDNSSDEEIGVEVVDGLDLPGEGTGLRNRRYAVNSVFQYLFLEERALTPELQRIAWVAPESVSYDTPISLWKNCIYKAMTQSPFFTFNKQYNTWRLNQLGHHMKEKYNEQVLWERWSEREESLRSDLLRDFWDMLAEEIVQGSVFKDVKQRKEDLNSAFAISNNIAIKFEIQFHKEFWLSLRALVSCGIFVKDEGAIQEVREEMDSIKTDLSVPIEANPVKSEGESYLCILSSKETRFDPNRVNLKPHPISRSTKPPIQNSDWLIDVAEEFYDVFSPRLTEEFDR